MYVDDLIYTGNYIDMMSGFRSSMKKEFSTTDLGKMKYFLGIQVVQSDDGVGISQRKYAAEILERFDSTSYK